MDHFGDVVTIDMETVIHMKIMMMTIIVQNVLMSLAKSVLSLVNQDIYSGSSIIKKMNMIGNVLTH